MRNDCEDVCYKLIERQLPVIPIGPDKKPHVGWKQYQSRLPERAEAKDWFKRWPQANIALVTGTLSGVDVIDFDPGHETWPASEHVLPTDCVVATPRMPEGGHYYVKHVDGARNSTGVLAEGVDVRAEGGYAILPPSAITKRSYRFVHGNYDTIAQIARGEARAPWLVDALSPRLGTSRRPESTPSNRIPEGRRNTTLTRLAGTLFGQGKQTVHVTTQIMAVNQAQCDPPLPVEEVIGIVESVARLAASCPDSVIDISAFACNDEGNARLITRLFGERLAYVHPRRKWHIFREGLWWSTDVVEERTQFAIEAAQCRQTHAVPLEADESRRHSKFALQSRNLHKINSALTLAAALEPIRDDGEGWDGDPWLLGASNGIVDLRTGELRPGTPGDKVSLHTEIDYDRNAACPRWLSFLDQVFDHDHDLVSFIHKSVGYTLTGDVSEQVLFILYGEGSNGKTVFLNTLRHVLGSYAANVPFSTFEARARSSIPNDVASICGARLVTAAETADTARFNVDRIKNLTGGDPVTARFLHQDYFTFGSVAKIWLSVNHRPRVDDNTHSFWRRVRLVPFHVQFVDPAKARRGQPAADKNLMVELRSEAPGILAWAVQGAIAWRDQGLTPPGAVVNAVDEYQRENDPLEDFLGCCCLLSPLFSERSAQLYEAYSEWCNQERIPEAERMTHKALAQRMKTRFEKKHTNTGNVYHGLRLRNQEDLDRQPPPSPPVPCIDEPCSE